MMLRIAVSGVSPPGAGRVERRHGVGEVEVAALDLDQQARNRSRRSRRSASTVACAGRPTRSRDLEQALLGPSPPRAARARSGRARRVLNSTVRWNQDIVVTYQNSSRARLPSGARGRQHVVQLARRGSRSSRRRSGSLLDVAVLKVSMPSQTSRRNSSNVGDELVVRRGRRARRVGLAVVGAVVEVHPEHAVVRVAARRAQRRGGSGSSASR